jgi:hypothetical protein
MTGDDAHQALIMAISRDKHEQVRTRENANANAVAKAASPFFSLRLPPDSCYCSFLPILAFLMTPVIAPSYQS